MTSTRNLFTLVFLIAGIANFVNCHNKYSADANKKADPLDFRPNSLKELDKPFRMAKLNMLWSKAKIVGIF